MPAKIPKKDLLEDLRACAKEADGRLTRSEYHDIGSYTERPFRRVFGTWNNALETAGLEVSKLSEVTPEMLNQDLRRVTDELGRVPSANEYRELGERGATSQIREFGSWKEAKVAAGLDEEFDYSTWEIPKKDLLDELRRLDDELEYPVSTTDIRDHARYAQKTYRDRFGTFRNAREGAGLPREIGQPKRRISGAELKDALRRLNEQISATPTQKLMNELGDYSARLYIGEFGSWNDALREVGLQPNVLEPREVECDYCGETTKKRVGRIERSERDFCTPECHANWMSESDEYRGENHPGWTGNPDYYGKNWKEQREKTLERDSYCCQSCGLTQDEHLDREGCELHIHHIIPIHEFDDPEEGNHLPNLVALCNQCHLKWEGIPVKPTLAESAA